MRFQVTQKALLHASNYINGGKTASKAHSEIMNALWWIVLVAGEHHPSLERDIYLCAIWQLHYQKQGLRSLHLEYALLRVLPYPFQRTVFGGSVTGPAVWLRLQWLALRRVKLQRCGGAVYLMEFFCFHLCLWGTEIFDFLFESFPDVRPTGRKA